MDTNETKTSASDTKSSLISDRTLAGGVLLIIGSVLLADRAGADLPHWLFTWPMILIAVGVFSGAKNGFREWSWLIPVTVGVVFLICHNIPGYSIRDFWPVAIIAVGVSMILNSGKKGKRSCW